MLNPALIVPDGNVDVLLTNEMCCPSTSAETHLFPKCESCIDYVPYFREFDDSGELYFEFWDTHNEKRRDEKMRK